jgi:hypothetical protein
MRRGVRGALLAALLACAVAPLRGASAASGGSNDSDPEPEAAVLSYGDGGVSVPGTLRRRIRQGRRAPAPARPPWRPDKGRPPRAAAARPRQDEWHGFVKRLSWKPRAFLFKKFLSEEECDHLIQLVGGRAFWNAKA